VFDTLLALVRHDLGGRHGSGKQFVSWVHDADFLAAIEFLIAHQELSGVVNVASPNPLPNSEFLRALREAWGARFAMPSPQWLIEIGAFFMRTESELVLKSRRVVPGRLQAAGFTFAFPDWPAAARDLVARWRQSRRSASTG
jgi:NAD dependent epimerase/dehydratase family enzyme